MYDTASPTVLRFLTSSSGMRTPNFSSALTTMVIIDSESMSRSSVKDLSGCTSSVGMPVSSFTISARPERIFLALAAIWFQLLWWWCAGGWVGGAAVWGGWVGRARRRRELSCSGQGNDLGGIDQAGTEADEQRRAAALGL